MHVVTAAIQHLPATLREEVEQRWQHFVNDHHPTITTEHQHRWQTLPKVWAASPWVANQCHKKPELLNWLSTPVLDQPMGRRQFRTELYNHLKDVGLDLAAQAHIKDLDDNHTALKQALRRFRQCMMVRIIWRDITGWAKTDHTIQELSTMADVVIDETLTYLQAHFFARYGHPSDYQTYRQRLMVIALGKLGGQELNLSSDVDLMFAYPADGTSQRHDGQPGISHQQLFTKIAQALIQCLHATTEEGIVFRVDMRLRPFGEQGPLVSTFDSLRDYYRNHGRDWERYALIKARLISGHGPHAAQLRTLIKAFVYHRDIDAHAMTALREMYGLIQTEIETQHLDQHVKLGPGGIRQIEFSAQVYQLIYGGSMVELQERRLMTVLTMLGEENFLSETQVSGFKKAYHFLRDVEHRLQAMHDQQTHTILEDDLHRTRLALAMHCHDWTAFDDQLKIHRDFVNHHFHNLMAQETKTSLWLDDSIPSASSAWKISENDCPEEANESPSAAPHAILQEAIQLLTTGESFQQLADKPKSMARHIVNYVWELVRQHKASAAAGAEMMRLLNKLCGIPAYLWLIYEKPSVIERLLAITEKGPWLCQLIKQHPFLLGELVYRIAPIRGHTLSEIKRRLARTLGYVPSDNHDDIVYCLQRFRRIHTFRTAVMDIDSTLTLLKVSDSLSYIAEAVIENAWRLATQQAIAALGAPLDDPEGSRMAILAYGRLGGLEMGYRSDCDLVLVYDDRPLHNTKTPDGSEEDSTGLTHDQTTSSHPDPETFYSRVARTLIHWLENQGGTGGAIYAVDTRLRPNGKAGLLVPSLSHFRDYQQHEAWLWEHQALVRARVICGDPALAESLHEVRRQVLCQKRDATVVKTEVKQMRQKILDTQGNQSHATAFHVKHGRGGVTDIEFIVQYCVLTHAHKHPDLAIWSDNFRILEACPRFGVLSEQESRDLHDIYLTYRQFFHRQDLAMRPYLCDDGRFDDLRQRVLCIWQRLLNTAPGPG